MNRLQPTNNWFLDCGNRLLHCLAIQFVVVGAAIPWELLRFRLAVDVCRPKEFADTPDCLGYLSQAVCTIYPSQHNSLTLTRPFPWQPISDLYTSLLPGVVGTAVYKTVQYEVGNATRRKLALDVYSPFWLKFGVTCFTTTASGKRPTTTPHSFPSFYSPSVKQTNTVLAMAPFETVRRALMLQVGGTRIYSGAIDCAIKLVREGGIGALYTGWMSTALSLIGAQLVYTAFYHLYP